MFRHWDECLHGPKCDWFLHLACWPCPRAITNEVIIVPSQHARMFTQANKHVERLPGLTGRSSGQLVALGSVIDHRLQLTWRAVSYHSEGSLSATNKKEASERASFLATVWTASM